MKEYIYGRTLNLMKIIIAISKKQIYKPSLMISRNVSSFIKVSPKSLKLNFFEKLNQKLYFKHFF